VTSAHPKEGKTSVSLNLAITLAQKGCRVLILDADFRRPGVTSTLGLLNKRGLSNILSGTETLEKCIGQVDTLENLWVLPTGPCPPHPAELLASPSMGCLLQTICQQFDHVIIDSPPVLLIADTMILSSMVDGVVIVVENEKTSRGAVVRACRVITNSGGRILGAVLNKVDARRDGYSGHYSYQDYYGYADYYSAEASTKRNSDQDSV
jgi:capsular exopolysaccharide synthesis family protein